MDELDDRFVPPSLKWIALACVLAVFGAIIAFRPDVPRELPPDVRGCYSAPNAPDVMIDAKQITVLQSPPLRRTYHLENQKGWVITVGQGFDWIELPGGQVLVVDGSPYGEFLSLTGEHDETPGTSDDFDLISRTLSLSIHYRRTAATCA